MSHLQDAFNQVCTEAITADRWYVVLMTSRPFYIGPQEGGTWGCDHIVEAYQPFVSEELANAAAEAVQKLADELSREAKRAYGRQCLREMEWCDQRGLDPDYLGEPDGEEEYYVLVTQEIPTNHYGERCYS